MTRDEKVFLFHHGCSHYFDVAWEVDKEGTNGVRVEKILKTVFENVSKIDL